MDPIITTAIVAALANLSKDAIKDSYVALKTALKKKFGETSDVVDAVDKLEKKPDSEARKATVSEEVEIAKVNDDPEILKLAQELLDKIKEQPGGQEIINQTQTNTVSGVTVGGNFEFKPVQEGKKS
jgi:predicted RND superfamily exporter protein